MTGLPKIVRDRLGRAAGGASALDHPDANLLTGFVERSLTERERSLVLGHLVQCAQCREQVSLALPKLEAEMAGVGGGVVRGWLRWPVLRWGLLVASLAIMGTVALVRQPPARRMELASRANVEAPPSAASLPSDITVGAAPAKAARPASPPGTGLTKRKPQNNDELALRFEATAQKAAPNRKVVPPQLKQEVLSYEASLTSKAPMAPSAPAPAPNVSPNAIELGSSNQTSNAAVAQAPSPPAATALVAPTQGQPSQQALNSLPSPQSKQAEASRAPEGEPVGGRSAPPSAKASRQLADSLAGAPRPPQAMLSKHAPLAASPTTSSALASTLLTADWSISASGKVQRSRDGRKSWEELDVDKNVVFRVVFAVGPDVWLGGSKGAIYHSTDGGQHWTKLNITTGSTTVADDVVHIEFRDTQHGTVGTAAGDSWTTTDAGQHWEKR
jgi:hypothetical protein